MNTSGIAFGVMILTIWIIVSATNGTLAAYIGLFKVAPAIPGEGADINNTLVTGSPGTNPTTGLFNMPSAPGASATSSGGTLGTGSSTPAQWSATNPYNVANNVSSSGVIVDQSDAPSQIDASL
jgi:hypothetical protein